MKLPSTMRVAGVDDLDLYLAATTSHDGTAALRVDATPVRIVCANTQRAAFDRTRGFYVFRHTSNVHSQISQASEAIGLARRLRKLDQQHVDMRIFPSEAVPPRCAGCAAFVEPLPEASILMKALARDLARAG